MGLFDWFRARPVEKVVPRVPDVPRIPDGRRTLDQPIALRYGVLSAGTRARFEHGIPVEAVLAEPLPMPEVVLVPGTKVELAGESGNAPALVSARLGEATMVGGLRLPAKTELEFDEEGRVTGAVLGAALVGEQGPAGMTWDQGAYLERIDGAWDLDPLARMQK